MKNNSLKKNFFFNFISQILILVIPLITTPYLARVLHEEGNGQISYAFSIVTYFILFANLGFTIYGQREISKFRNDKEKLTKTFYEIFFVRMITTTISIVILAIILFTIGFGEKYNLLITIYGIQLIAVYFDIQFFYQGTENFKSIALRSIIMKVIGLVCIFLFVKEETDIWKYALFISLATIFSNLIMWPYALKQVGICKAKEIKIFRHILPALLIFLPSLAVTIYSVFDKTMIGLLSSNSDYENGCYGQAYKLNNVMLLLVTVISPVLTARNNYDYSHNNEDGFKEHLYFSSNYVWLIGLPLIAGCIVLSKNLCTWYLGDGYAEVPLLLSIMAVRFVASGLSELFGTQYLIVIGKEKYVLISSIIAACMNLGCNFIMIPFYGSVGASIATAICEVSMTIVLGIFVYKQHFVSEKKIILMCFKYLFSALIMGLLIYLINSLFVETIWSFLLCVLIGAIAYFLMLILLKDKFVINILRKVKIMVLKKN